MRTKSLCISVMFFVIVAIMVACTQKHEETPVPVQERQIASVQEHQNAIDCFLSHKGNTEDVNVGQSIEMTKLFGVKFGDFTVYKTGDGSYELILPMTNRKGISYDLDYEVRLNPCSVKPLNDPAKSFVSE